jgi:predicted alpha/beta-hydrolase family hydrolase
MTTSATPLRVPLDDGQSVSALLQRPPSAAACYVLAHGAGAGMTHPFMAAVADGLAARGIATLRYQFPYVENGSRRPDTPTLAHATVRAACRLARAQTGLPLIAGGKSFGGRMTSQAQAIEPLADVAGLAFLGFPLHAPDKPSIERARHLAEVRVPMLFVQGTRDKLAELSLITGVVGGLGAGATLRLIDHADHGFEVLVRSGRKPAEVMTEVLDALAGWMRETVRAG